MATSNHSGIKSFGAYIPRRRMQRAAIAAAHSWAFPSLKSLGKGERAMCSWDEDVITMAVEAGRDCLRGVDANAISDLTLASTTAPFADINNAMLVGAALRLPKSAGASDSAGSTRAGLSALIRACRSADAGNSIVIASEKRSAKPGSVQEMQYGAGAGALSVGRGDGVIARFLGSETVSVPFIDHFRNAEKDFDYFWEERWIRDEGVAKIVPSAVKRLLENNNLSSERVSWFGLAGAPSGSDKLTAKSLGLPPEKLLPDLQAQVGDTGAAHPVLMLVAAMERAKVGDIIVVASFAQGCEIVAFEWLGEKPADGRRGLAGAISDRIEESAYLKLLSFDGQIDLDWGMRAETDNKSALTQLYRASDQILAFVGGKCEHCGAVQFPRLPNCVDCGETGRMAEVSLSDEPAKIATYTADWLQYSPSPPLYMGLVQFHSGARLLMEISDVGSAGIEVGTPLKMAFRIKERDRLRGFNRYFWKAVPAPESGE